MYESRIVRFVETTPWSKAEHKYAIALLRRAC